MPFVEDLSEFFDTDEHASAATYSGSTIKGIFKDEYVMVRGVESSVPVYVCAESDVPSVSNSSQIIINGVTYSVIEPQPDGTGLIRLVLNET